MSPSQYGSTAFYIEKAFKELGHNIIHEYNKEAEETSGVFAYAFVTPNVIVGVDGTELPKAIDGIPYIYWDTDSFLHAPVVMGDHLFIGGCPEDLKKYPEGTIFLPHAADPELHRPMYVEKEYDIVMVGSTDERYGERNRILELLKSKYKVHVAKTRPGLAYSQELSKGKIIFNCSMTDTNIPMRFFEGMAIGVLVTNYSKNLDSLAQRGLHYLGYEDDEELISTIEEQLRDTQRNLWMPKEARKHILENHTYKHRALTLLSCLN